MTATINLDPTLGRMTPTHTPTPWSHNGVSIQRVTSVGNGDLHITPIAKVCSPSPLMAQSDAALIMKRVNGWDALVAERDQLKAANGELRALLMTLMDVAKEGLLAPGYRTYDYEPRCVAAYDKAVQLLRETIR